MPFEIKVPQLGESVVEATVGQWHKQVGDAVNIGEPLLELETDKVDLEVSAEQAGVLQSVAHNAGDTVKIGDVLGVIGEGAASSGNGAGQQATAPQTPLPQAEVSTPVPAATPAAAQPAPAPEAARETEPPATPLARRVAEDKGVDLSSVPATGARGRATRDDVLTYLAHSAPATQPLAPAAPAEAPKSVSAPAPKPGPIAAQPSAPGVALAAQANEREEHVRMTRRRKVIAERLVAAQHTAAMLTTFNEIDMSAVMEIRKRRKDKFLEKNKIGLGFMSFFTKASIGALKAFPRLNAELQGDDLILKHHYDIGIAIGAEEGLVVPVVRDADRMSFAQIEQAISEFAAKSKAGSLALEDLRGGTFTITNGGTFGSLMSTPILNPPQVGILGMHKIQERPIAVNGQVVIRPMMYVALTYDHRIVDGREAVQFLVRVKELIEDPEMLLLEG